MLPVAPSSRAGSLISLPSLPPLRNKPGTHKQLQLPLSKSPPTYDRRRKEPAGVLPFLAPFFSLG